jgi:hypothetical protein
VTSAEETSQQNPPRARTIAASVFWDAGLSLIAYFVMRALGQSEYLALLAGSVAALLRVLFVAVKNRKFDVFAGFMMAVFAVGLSLSLLTGDPKFLLLKESFGTAAAGLLFLGSCVIGRPLIFHAAKRIAAPTPEQDTEWEQRWANLPGFRRPFTVMSAVWGCGLLAEAIVRVPLVFLLPTDVMVVGSTVMFLATMAGLAIWNGRYVRALARRGLRVDTPAPVHPTS